MTIAHHEYIRNLYGPVLDWVTGPRGEAQPSAGGAFRLHYVTRNRLDGHAVGLCGVENTALLNAYADALDQAYDYFATGQAGVPWELPRRSDDLKAVPVFVTRPVARSLDAFTFTFAGESSVWLRNLLQAPDASGIVQQAQVDATHEVAHLFTHRHHAPSPSPFDPWKWFDEATAVYIERELQPALFESIRYGVYWSYAPELGLSLLNNEASGYFAGWFLRYLVRLLNFDLIRDVWHDPNATGPIAALDALLRARCGSSFADVFTDYASNTYSYGAFDNEVYLQCGERSLAGWFAPACGVSCTGPTADMLAPYACRYYRIDAPAGATRLNVTVRPELAGAAHLRARVIAVDHARVVLGSSDVPLANGAPSGIGLPIAAGTHHVVVVVVNAPPPEDLRLHDPRLVQEYTVTATLY